MFITHAVEKHARAIHEHIFVYGNRDSEYPYSRSCMMAVDVMIRASSYEEFDYNGNLSATYEHLFGEGWHINMIKYPYQTSGNRDKMFRDLILFRLTHDLS
jgi:hypothetical protein